jgi:hypothetical protein
MMGGVRFACCVASLFAGLGALGCNTVLDIQDPIESIGGSGGVVVTATPGDSTSGSAGSSGSMSMMTMSAKDGGTAPAAASPSLEWAQWPMPNPIAAGLPNAASYDSMSLTGVVIDLVTGLQWQQTVDEMSYTWDDAASYCTGLTLAGGAWRLPTRIELVSLVDYTVPNPVIDQSAFPDTPADYFWSSSPYAGDATNAWNVNFRFSDGIADKSEKSKAHRVRCVR